MTGLAEPLFVHRVRGMISSSPLLVDANEDGWPEIFVGGPVLTGLSWNGQRLPRWPKRGRRPFASSPAFGDINGDGRGEVVIGCDDGAVYAFFFDGESVPGFPTRTQADVFSTPALADLDGDKALEIAVGSDDGTVRVLRGDGSVKWVARLPGRPFVSASPTVADLDQDRGLEIAVGAWDKRLHVLSASGEPEGWSTPAAANVVWSSATAFEMKRLGRHLAWAADRMYLTQVGGGQAPGWPVATRSWMVSSPAVVELEPESGGTVAVGSEKLYAWDLRGRLRPGWPVDVGDYVWSSPIAFDLDGDGIREILVGSWDGGIHAIRADGSTVPGFPLRTEGPIFATVAASPLPSGGGILVAASWDGTVRGWRLPAAAFRPTDWLQYRGGASRQGWQPQSFEPPPENGVLTDSGAERSELEGAKVESWPDGRRLHRVQILGKALENARSLHLCYVIAREGRVHRVPAVNSRETFVALVQPLRIPHRIRYWIEMERGDGGISRWPERGERPLLTPGLL